MPATPEALAERLRDRFAHWLTSCDVACDEVTIEVSSEHFVDICRALRDEPEYRFDQLIDLCGVDYGAYGKTEWATESASGSGFSRGRDSGKDPAVRDWPHRFAVVAHLLSVALNHRLRLRTFCPDDDLPMVSSVTDVWAAANWFEREAFDLFGIVFEGHPDLRRILTDYGFIGHPFRKDFPLWGHVEMRYDPERQRVVYQPVTIEPRVLVPRVIRHDSRYAQPPAKEPAADA
jgi:NADH-quinone oxidoreductase subunit C